MNYEILVASSNKNKVREIREILSPHKIVVYGVNDLNLPEIDVEETGDTYAANALLKAEAYAKLVSMPVIADDSGVEVEAIDNKPGLESARFAKKLGGYDKAMEYIIKATKEKNNNKAKFICYIAAMNIDTKPLLFEGIVPGIILTQKEGENGFGYDPIFKSNECEIPFGKLSANEKNLYSHRAKALKKLITYLKINNKCI